MISKWSPANTCRRLFGWLTKTGFRKRSEQLILGLRGKWFQPDVNLSACPDAVVVTVAHGDLYNVAQTFARKHNLPLVTFFHDWWPDIANVGGRFRTKLESEFQKLYCDSDLALCVSPGMKEHLDASIQPHTGNSNTPLQHPNASILYPIPAIREPSSPPRTRPKGSRFKIVYAGNLVDYGPMLADLMPSIRNHPDLRLEVRGKNPNWPINFQNEMRQNKMWLPFARSDEFAKWMNSADAFLIPQSFEPADRRKMETNFPSKISEMAQFGKPLVVWAPESASGSQWCQTNNHGLNVTSRDLSAVISELERLAADNSRISELSTSARRAAATEFDPKRIQAQFVNEIKRLLQTAKV